MNECENLALQMNAPTHVVNNLISPEATLIMVNSSRKRGFLLEVVQILTDLNLSIRKAYISSHGHCFMNVFHVTDQGDSKLSDNVIGYIEHYLGRLGTNVVPQTSDLFRGLTELELTGTDRPGLLAEVFAIIARLRGNVYHTKFWTHNGRYASVIYFKDEDTGSFLSDSHKLARVQKQLEKVLKGDHNVRAAKTAAPMADTDIERRLHQLMFADGDYELSSSSSGSRVGPPTVVVVVEDWWVRGYTAVKVRCRDRQKLLFDLVCALTDMKCAIFHACIDSDSSEANLEFSIRHEDGTPIYSDTEVQRLMKCMQAAVDRRVFEGVMLELEAPDRLGILADVTSIFKEKGLNVTGVDVPSSDKKAANVFHVTPHAAGHPVKAKDIEEALQLKIGQSSIKVKEPSHGRISRVLSRLRI